ncbi:MAG: hypothetical protein V3U88_11310 [Methylococcales bacterium]
MKSSYIVLIFVVLFILAIKLLTPDRSTQPVLINGIDTSSEKQVVRERLINQLKETGAINKIEISGSLPYVYIGKQFKKLENHEKETMMSTISDYYYTLNKKTTMVIIKDPNTNKRIGKYNQNGFSMKDKRKEQ